MRSRKFSIILSQSSEQSDNQGDSQDKSQLNSNEKDNINQSLQIDSGDRNFLSPMGIGEQSESSQQSSPLVSPSKRKSILKPALDFKKPLGQIEEIGFVSNIMPKFKLDPHESKDVKVKFFVALAKESVNQLKIKPKFSMRDQDRPLDVNDMKEEGVVSVQLGNKKIVLQPKYMNYRGSMCYTELWSNNQLQEIAKLTSKKPVAQQLSQKNQLREVENYKPELRLKKQQEIRLINEKQNNMELTHVSKSMLNIKFDDQLPLDIKVKIQEQRKTEKQKEEKQKIQLNKKNSFEIINGEKYLIKRIAQQAENKDDQAEESEKASDSDEFYLPKLNHSSTTQNMRTQDSLIIEGVDFSQQYFLLQKLDRNDQLGENLIKKYKDSSIDLSNKKSWKESKQNSRVKFQDIISKCNSSLQENDDLRKDLKSKINNTQKEKVYRAGNNWKQMEFVQWLQYVDKPTKVVKTEGSEAPSV